MWLRPRLARAHVPPSLPLCSAFTLCLALTFRPRTIALRFVDSTTLEVEAADGKKTQVWRRAEEGAGVRVWVKGGKEDREQTVACCLRPCCICVVERAFPSREKTERTFWVRFCGSSRAFLSITCRQPPPSRPSLFRHSLPCPHRGVLASCSRNAS